MCSAQAYLLPRSGACIWALHPQLAFHLPLLLSWVCLCSLNCERSVMAGRLRGGDAAGAGRGAAAALAVAIGLGVAILVLLGLFGERLICLTGCAPNLVAPALTYLRVRMLAAPAVVITMVAQVWTLPAFRLPSTGLTGAGMLQQSKPPPIRTQAFSHTHLLLPAHQPSCWNACLVQGGSYSAQVSPAVPCKAVVPNRSAGAARRRACWRRRTA